MAVDRTGGESVCHDEHGIDRATRRECSPDELV
jgi:hypothetical protein